MSKISLKHSGGNVVSLNSPTSAPTSADVAFKAYRGSTLLPVGTSGTGNMTNASFGGFQEQGNSQFGVQTAAWQYLDSPSSTSALTYKLQWSSVYQPGGTYQIYLNRPYNADNNSYNIFGVSTVTAMEVAA